MSAATDHPYAVGYRVHLDHVAVGDQPQGIGCLYDSRGALMIPPTSRATQRCRCRPAWWTAARSESS